MPTATQSQPITLSLFGGENTEIDAISLPEGLSPSCQDVAFLPGSVFTRPALNRLYTTNGASIPVNYVKTYLRQNGDPITLFITGADGTAKFGQLWQEDVLNAPGVVTLVANVPLGAMARSTTTDDAEYFAFSNGIQGTGIPAFFDGTNFTRVSQDGPGAAPVTSDFTPVINITASPNGLKQHTTSNILSVDSIDQLGTITVSGAIPPGVQVGDSFKIAGTADFNGTYSIIAFASTTSLNFTFLGADASDGAAGTVTWALTDVIPTSTITAIVGANVTIAGAGVAGYDGTWQIRNIISSSDFQVYLPTFGLANSGNGTVTFGGSVVTGGITAGVHQFVVMFQTKAGYITKVSPVGSWTAAGGLYAKFDNIPLGPPNIESRIIALTQAGGSKFTYIPATVTIPSLTGGSPTIIQSTVVPDNTSTTFTLSFSDASLATGLAIDIQGNDRFAVEVLGLPVGAYQYANRTVWSGDTNKVQNFTNMGFEGGVLSLTPPLLQPLWWVVNQPGGKIVTGSDGYSWQWQITGDGTNAQRGEIFQSAYQDFQGVNILNPNMQYSVRFWLKSSLAGMAGSVSAQIFSTSTVFNSIATVNASSISTAGAFYTVQFSLPTPATIPTDMNFAVFIDGIGGTGVPNNETITIDEIEVFVTNQPFLSDRIRLSYLNDPESFDGVTGFVAPEHPEQPIVGLFEIRDQLYIIKSGSLYMTQDNGTTEPDQWTIQQISGSIGAMSFRAFDIGEDWAVIADKSGAFMFSGGQPLKISQEMQSTWDQINPAAYNTVWVKNDRANRRIYFGLPIGEAQSPNIVLVLDYRELKSAQDITFADPEHISYSGRVLSTDLSRKWTVWNIAANAGEIIYRPNNVQEMVLGGARGFGLTNGGFNNLYYLNSAKFTDDDYGQILSFYTTYFFLPPDAQQQLQLAGLNLYEYLKMFISGVGNMQLTFLGDSLTNAWPLPPLLPLPASPVQDYELSLNVQIERMAIQFSVLPLNGTMDAAFNLSKLFVWVRPSVLGLRGVF